VIITREWGWHKPGDGPGEPSSPEGHDTMGQQSLRDSAMTALILEFFASSWFGWAQEHPPEGWRWPLAAGSVASLAVAAIGGIYV
jgi:hypothetical protein